MLHDITFPGHMAQGTAAMTAFCQGRLLVAQPLQAGTCAWAPLFLLERRQGRLQKVRWRGPTTVVFTEPNSVGSTTVRWLVHGTSLVRCSPVHVRADVADVEHSCTDNLEPARSQLGVARHWWDSIHGF